MHNDGAMGSLAMNIVAQMRAFVILALAVHCGHLELANIGVEANWKVSNFLCAQTHCVSVAVDKCSNDSGLSNSTFAQQDNFELAVGALKTGKRLAEQEEVCSGKPLIGARTVVPPHTKR